ncbi:MAG: HTH domain-containing protein [Clostridia bacterium]|nr:HTH domain-containing protein [Clostridia bacterium]
MEKNIRVSMLTEMYGKLLTDKQFDVVDLYYNNNLSLSEIAEELGITRQGVRKILVSAENHLFEIEEKLGFLEQKLQQRKVLSEVIRQTEDKWIKEKLTNLL